eukprot:sb/3466538/
MYSTPLWPSGRGPQLLITLSIRLLSISRPIIPCNPLCVISQLLPDFVAFSGVAGITYILFNVAIHTVYTSTTPDSVTTFFTVLFLSLQSVVTTPGDGSRPRDRPVEDNVPGYVWFLTFLFLVSLTDIIVACQGKIEVSHRSCDVEKRCSLMKMVMMYEGCHPVPPPFNLVTLPLTILSKPCTRRFKKGIKRVVWGDQEGTEEQFYLHNREDTLARVCARLKTLQQKNSAVEQEDFYDTGNLSRISEIRVVYIYIYISVWRRHTPFDSQIDSALRSGRRRQTDIYRGYSIFCCVVCMAQKLRFSLLRSTLVALRGTKRRVVQFIANFINNPNTGGK